ncbi:transmembrane 4 L6 family member 1-like [Lethenteron reissneri]|uniref:transmembrane 4 L6 family member 1-like n=1 Tax=Lethenteron reissneri TaxID=7753 RepID=UPI002AB6DAD6|nr:transmembrane 4 L6 family member 1-like [Lethenteron reissneri]
MCTGKCADFIGKALIPLAVLSILANILLFFPDAKVEFASNNKLTPQVWFFHGIVGAGLLMFIPALLNTRLDEKGCCGNRCGMLFSVLFNAVGIVGAGYCFIVSVTGMVDGPFCMTDENDDESWMSPFINDTMPTQYLNLSGSYLFNQDVWTTCKKPVNVVLWNIVLFSMLICFSGAQVVLCATQMINGLIGVLCGTCMKNEVV